VISFVSPCNLPTRCLMRFIPSEVTESAMSAERDPAVSIYDALVMGDDSPLWREST
jgi:hypothetical protein